MSTNYHTAIATGESNAPATLNSRFSTIDAAIAARAAEINALNTSGVGSVYAQINNGSGEDDTSWVIDNISGTFLAGATVVYSVAGVVYASTVAANASASPLTVTAAPEVTIPDNTVISQVPAGVAGKVLDKVINVQDPVFGFVADGTTDNTAAWTDVLTAAVDGDTIIFPKGTYVGNFTSTKSLNIDGRGSTFIPQSDSAPVFKFEGTINSSVAVTGNPGYGDRTFVVADATGLSEDQIGYLADGTDSNSGINAELVKIANISGTTITVYDMIRSELSVGSVVFYPIDSLDAPTVKNVVVAQSNTNTQPSVWFEGCTNAVAENVQVSNSYGHAVRFFYCYNWSAENIRVIKPRATTSGLGYGLTGWYCRYGYVRNVYGVACRHIFDINASYITDIAALRAEESIFAPVILSHNGFGGSVKLDGVYAEFDGNAVQWSNQRIESGDEDNQLVRDVTIKNVRHIVPTLDPTSGTTDALSVYIQHDYANVLIDNVDMRFVIDTGTPVSDHRTIRMLGNQRGPLAISNISANRTGALIWLERRDGTGGTHVYPYRTIINGLQADEALYAVRLRGHKAADIDNVHITTVSDCVFFVEDISSIDTDYLSIGPNVYYPSASTDVIDYSAGTVPTKGYQGQPPQANHTATTSQTLSGGETIAEDWILVSGGRIRLVAPVSSDATLDATAPLAAPLWYGQKLFVSVNTPGTTGSRGNVIIPGGSNTCANTSNVTLSDGNTYQFIATDARKWQLVQ